MMVSDPGPDTTPEKPPLAGEVSTVPLAALIVTGAVMILPGKDPPTNLRVPP